MDVVGFMRSQGREIKAVAVTMAEARLLEP